MQLLRSKRYELSKMGMDVMATPFYYPNLLCGDFAEPLICDFLGALDNL